MSNPGIVQAYRSLFRSALQAVHYSSPAKYQIRDILRRSFRGQPVSNYKPRRVQNTISFLQRAKEYNGIEHKILRNILFQRFWRDRRQESKLIMQQTDLAIDIRKNIWVQFDATLTLLNESMDLCLRS